MDAVVVGDVGDVVVAQRHEERQQRLLRDLERVAQVAVLKDKVNLRPLVMRDAKLQYLHLLNSHQ